MTDDRTPWLPPGRVLDLPGRGRTFVRDTGERARPAVLLLHGWTVTADLNFFHAYPALAERFRVIALDHRGHGRGVRPDDGRVRLSDCADDAAAVLDQLGIDDAIVVGYSMGGLVTQLLWRRHPERVRGAVFGSTAAHLPTGALRHVFRLPVDPVGWWANRRPDRADAWVRTRVERRVTPGDRFERWMRDEYRRGDGAGLITSLRSLGRFDSSGWIGGFDRPATSIVTATDTVVPAAHQRRLASLTGASVVVFDGPHDAVVTHHRAYVPVLVEAVAGVAEA